MKNATQQGSAASLGLAGEFLSATLSRKSRDFPRQDGAEKAVWALGRTSPQSLLLLCYGANRIRGPKSAVLESGFFLHYPILSLLSPEIIVLLLLL